MPEPTWMRDLDAANYRTTASINLAAAWAVMGCFKAAVG